MIKKEPADHVLFNVKFANRDDEAIAIYQNQIIAIGSIPHIFSNYRGFEDYNAQGFKIEFRDQSPIEINQIADGLVVFQSTSSENSIIWEIVNGNCIARNTDLLDPHWDDH